MLLEPVAGDSGLQNLSRAFDDLHDAGVSPIPLEWIVRPAAVGAVNLQSVVRDAVDHCRREVFRHSACLYRGGVSTCTQVSCMPAKETRGLQIRHHAADHSLYQLEFRNGDAELFAMFRVVEGGVQAGARQSRAAPREVISAGVE